MTIYNNPHPIFICSALFGLIVINGVVGSEFQFREASVHEIQIAFKENRLTSTQLVKFYLKEIERLNPILKGVLEVNPDAIRLAQRADRERRDNATKSMQGLHGIPILVKDNIATKDKLNTTGGSYALLGSVVPRDAGVVKKLREAGAVILGKASMSEWSYSRSSVAPNGWSARGGQGVNPYDKAADPCGSSSGSAISVAANMVTVSLGTETDGSILCPSSSNSVVGIKPTVGLTSRGGVIPYSLRQDSVGPICRTVSDAVYVLDAIVGFDKYDPITTRKASKYIPIGGYTQFLKDNGLKGKRLGITSYLYFGFPASLDISSTFKNALNALRQSGAILVEHEEIANFDTILSFMFDGEAKALSAELKLSLNRYLQELVTSPVRSLADIIDFNNNFSDLEMTNKYGQDGFLEAEKTRGINKAEMNAMWNMIKASRDGFEKLMRENELDALVTPYSLISPVLAIGGYPGIAVPAGYNGSNGVPYGISFGGLKGSEPKLIEIAYGFEQATKIRKPPSFQDF